MLTAYGIYGCYTQKKLMREMDMNSLDLELSETGTVTKGEFSEAFLACPSELTDGIDMILVYVKYTEEEGVRPLELRFTVREGKISSCSLFAHNLEQNRMITVYFSEEQEEKGEAVALTYKGMDQEIQGWLKNMENPDGTLSILGKEYKVIGRQSWAEAVLIPYQSLEDDTALYNDFGFSLSFHEPVTRDQYNQLKETLTAQLGDRVIFPEREIYDFNQLYLYNTILLINGFILLAAALNFALLYRYILMKRKKNLAVFQLCGLLLSGGMYSAAGSRDPAGVCLLLPAGAPGAGRDVYRHLDPVPGKYLWEVRRGVSGGFPAGSGSGDCAGTEQADFERAVIGERYEEKMGVGVKRAERAAAAGKILSCGGRSCMVQ